MERYEGIRIQLEELKEATKKELEEMNHNSLKESLLLLHKDDIGFIFFVCTELECSNLAKHGALSIYSAFQREYHLQTDQQAPGDVSKHPKRKEKCIWMLVCILLSSKMNDLYHRLSIKDLLSFVEGAEQQECIKSENIVLRLLGYNVAMRGGIPLRPVHFALLHYATRIEFDEGESNLLCGIGERVLEQTLIHKRMVSITCHEYVLSVVLVAIALHKRNGLLLCSSDLEWGAYISPLTTI